jgi:hypothetical protein
MRAEKKRRSTTVIERSRVVKPPKRAPGERSAINITNHTNKLGLGLDRLAYPERNDRS